MTSFEKGLVWTTRIGVFCVPFVPLVVASHMFFPFITGKNFAFRIIVEIIFAVWIVLALRLPEYRPKRSYLLYALSAFLFIMLIADAFGANPLKSFWSNFERMEGFVTLVHLFAYFLVAGSVLATEKLWLRFFATSVGISALLGFYGVLQLAGKIVINQGGVRLDGTFGNAAYFAGYMLFHFFLTLFLLARHRISSWAKWCYGVALALQLFVLYFSATRGAAVGFFVGTLLSALLILILEKNNPRVRRISLGILIAIMVIVGALYAGKNSDFIRNNSTLSRFASISVEDAGPRFMVWGMAFQGFKERPLLGWGQENFNFVFNKYYNPHMWGQEQWFDRTHNIFFDWLIAGGLLGLLSYLSLFAVLLYYLWRKREGREPFSLLEKSVLTGLLAAYFTHNFFVFDNLGSYLLFFSLLAFIHTRVGAPFARLERTQVLPFGTSYYVAASVVVTALLGSLYFVNVRNMLTATDLITGLKPQAGGIGMNLKAYERALSHGSLGEQESVEQLTVLAAQVATNANVSAADKEAFTSTTLHAQNTLIARVPNDARFHVFASSFLIRLGRTADAAKELEIAHTLSPTKQAISFDLASVYLQLGKKTEALAVLKTAFEGAPEFESARISYAVAAVYNNRFDIVEEVLKPYFKTVVVPDDRLVKAYFDVKRYDLVLAIWKGRAVAQPQNVQYKISLAAAYLLTGDRAQAIQALQEAEKLKPDAKAEIEKYIAEIRAGRNP